MIPVHSALRAIESRTLTDYIFSERIEFIADYPGTVAFAERISAPGLRARLDLLQTVQSAMARLDAAKSAD